jgi:Amt family ammonium transporter
MKTLPTLIAALLVSATLSHAQSPVPEPQIEKKLDGILTKIEASDKLNTKLDGIMDRLDASDKLNTKLEGILETLKEQGQALKSIGTTAPSAPVAAAVAAPVAPPPAVAAPVAAAAEVVASTASPNAIITGVSEIQSNINYVWIIITAAMVFFMQAGFVMLEIGACRAKNTINIVMKSFLDFCICAIVYLFIG